ncbi:unnamed protein product [Didymodactylos carnosus]|nr:unnamed protein product [Didymodactylos carnosus]CAF4104705.1 unnamed protein product [Didymodactylos carnosus]
MVPVKVPSKNKKKSRSQKQQQTKKQEEPPSATCVVSEVCSSVEQQSTSQIVHHYHDEDNKKDGEMNTSIERLFSNQEFMSSTTNEEKDHQTTSSSSTLPSRKTTTKIEETDFPIVSIPPPDNEDDDIINQDDSNAATAEPVVAGEISFGASTTGGKMVFLNMYGYIYMNETKDYFGWRCVKRNENCKAVIYTFKSTGQFSHWNGKFHCHVIDLRDTRKREIISKIKNRVLDEFIPIKVIIEEEYRKAKHHEKSVLPEFWATEKAAL